MIMNELLNLQYNQQISIENTQYTAVAMIKFTEGSSYWLEYNFKKLLPRAKCTKKLPLAIDRETFIKIFNEETCLKHKCWLLLAYCSGLREEEVASYKDIRY